ncbi:MAG: 5-formyltetrahydrofolate cyclo-ligase [Evtepia sp.]|jgi:5-formyltetrahydrofolate cyclo-ligase|nr:5-formyltetrahydrofolate cyclo-ligase [Evtepia sp.]
MMKSEEIQSEKARLRQQLRSRMRNLSLEEKQRSDKALFAALFSLPELTESKTVLLFYGIKEEPETRLLIPELQARGKQVYLPRCLPERQMEARLITKDSDLLPGTWNIPEPTDDCPVLQKDQLDLILVPALCCDREGFRLGQGGGYYDRYLEGYHGVTVCLCRKAFLQEKLPCNVFDQKVKIVLMEEERLVLPKAQ